ncbi:hypothetical protein CEXT_571231 [Caerostris extrusa]|uniref:Uncharacterized protein n=1 Tax=Caerostris extrusa TaxID=172846 RepID=A0AAV4NFY0_CAEEX|nr:hypothetical protein CEXT_571231 [Caerostris extrusa]
MCIDIISEETSVQVTCPYKRISCYEDRIFSWGDEEKGVEKRRKANVFPHPIGEASFMNFSSAPLNLQSGKLKPPVGDAGCFAFPVAVRSPNGSRFRDLKVDSSRGRLVCCYILKRRFLGIDSLAKEEGSIRKRIRIDHCRPNAVLACAERNHWADYYRDLVVFSSCKVLRLELNNLFKGWISFHQSMLRHQPENDLLLEFSQFHIHRYFETFDTAINERELILFIALLKRSASGLHSVDGSRQLQG